MSYIVTQDDINILRQSNRILYSKIELLNHSFKVIDCIEGNLISDSISIDSSSDIRRTYTLTLHVSDSTFVLGSDSKIWIDKYVRPYIGIYSQHNKQVIWYLQGTFLFNEATYTYDETTRNVSLTCSDLMCGLTGTRGSFMSGLNIKIVAEIYIRDAIIGLLKDAGIVKYRVQDIGKYVPYDLEHSAGTSYYDLLKELVDLYAGYEMFFDLDGTFVVQAIPTTKDEVSVLSGEIIAPLVISEQINNSFDGVYNKTEIWGSTIETDYYTKSCSSTNGITYTATVDSATEYDNFSKYGIRIPRANAVNPTININGLGDIPIYDDDGNRIAAGRLLANTDYVFKYRRATKNLNINNFLLLGQYQAYGEYTCKDSDCPYSTVNLGYELRQVLQFEELESDSLCIQRAKYETWLSTKMKNNITLTMIPISFLDVNWKISYTSYMGMSGCDYIIKSISGSNSEHTMTVNLISYSELYPDIIPQ